MLIIESLALIDNCPENISWKQLIPLLATEDFIQKCDRIRDSVKEPIVLIVDLPFDDKKVNQESLMELIISSLNLTKTAIFWNELDGFMTVIQQKHSTKISHVLPERSSNLCTKLFYPQAIVDYIKREFDVQTTYVGYDFVGLALVGCDFVDIDYWLETLVN